MANILTKVADSIIRKAMSYSSIVGASTGFQSINDTFSSIFGSFNTFKLKKYVGFYYENPYLYQSVDKIASAVSAMPRILEDGKGNAIESGPIFDLWNRPNEDQSTKTFLKILATNFLATGNAFTWMIQAVGFKGVQEMIGLRSSDTKINVGRSSGEVTGYDYRNLGKITTYPKDVISHIHEPNIISSNEDQFYGIPKAEPSKMSIITSNEVLLAQASSFKNKGASGFITNESDVPMQPKERDRVQASVDENVGGADKMNKWVVTSSKLSAVQLGMSPSDLKLIESGIAQLRIISANHNLGSALFNDPDNKTYNNMLETNRAAYNDSYIPTAEFIDAELSHELSKRFGKPVVIKIDKAQIEVLKETKAEVSARTINEFANGIITLDVAIARVEALND